LTASTKMREFHEYPNTSIFRISALFHSGTS
jgi:hypothetical protein